MSTATASHTRTVRLELSPNAEGKHGLIVITDTFGETQYLVDRVAATKDGGPAFNLQQLGTYETFHVNFPHHRKHVGNCSCLQGWRFADCTHLKAIIALRKAGRL